LIKIAFQNFLFFPKATTHALYTYMYAAAILFL